MLGTALGTQVLGSNDMILNYFLLLLRLKIHYGKEVFEVLDFFGVRYSKKDHDLQHK